MFSRVAALFAAVSSSAAGAAEPQAVAPRAKWVIDFAEQQCVAYRDYGTEEDPLYLVLKAPPLGEVIQLMVMRKGSTMLPEEVPSTVTFGNGAPLKKSMLVFRPDDAKYRTYLVNIPRAEFDPIRHASAIGIRSGWFNYSFQLSEMHSLLKVVDECVVDLKKYWNVSDPGLKNPRLRQEARGDLKKVFSSLDYPWTALKFNEEGTTHVIALIDEKGGVADCTIIQTSGVASLDAQACAVIKERAKFEPAIDVDGKPARDGYSQRIMWKLGIFGR